MKKNLDRKNKIAAPIMQQYEENQETLALLEILALGNKQIEKNQIKSASKAIGGIRKRKILADNS